jgi:hypothetical protein
MKSLKVAAWIAVAQLWSVVAVAELPGGVRIQGGTVKIGTGGKEVEVGRDGAVSVEKGGKRVRVDKQGGVEAQEGSRRVQVRDGGEVKLRDGSSDVELNSGGGGRTRSDEAESGPLHLEGSGKVVTHSCGKGASARIEGSKNNVVLQGTCTKVSVVGSDNSVTTETVSEISIKGSNNRVTWVSGPKGRKPKMSQTGLGNLITQATRR